MAFLKRDEAKQIVVKSIKTIADLPAGDIEQASLAMLNDDQTQIFLSTLKSNINEYQYHLRDGTPSDDAYYDVALTVDIIKEWKTVGNCIDWIIANQKTIDKN